MTEISINGHGLTALRVIVSNNGPWIAECDLQESPTLPEQVTIIAGGLRLQGTTRHGGEYGLQRKVRVVAGASGWSTEIGTRGYHNDAGVKARLVAEDAARACGETIGQFVPVTERLGRDFVRASGVAARALEIAAGGNPWWVDYEGTTHVGPRARVGTIASERCQVLAYDPRSRIATLAPDDPADVAIGATLGQLPNQGSVREFQLEITAAQLRVTAWLSIGDSDYGKLANAVRGIVNRANDVRLWGHYRYRVVSQRSDGRVDLQCVRNAAGLPDVATISQWPGIPGLVPRLTPSSEVLIAFIEGDPAQPVLTHYAGEDGAGFAPVSLVLGGSDGPACARVGDAVEVLLVPGTFTGTINGLSAVGVITWPAQKMEGTITTGSTKVKVAG